MKYIICLILLIGIVSGQGSGSVLDKFESALNKACTVARATWESTGTEECAYYLGCETPRSLLNEPCNGTYGEEQDYCNCNGRVYSRNFANVMIADGTLASSPAAKKYLCATAQIWTEFDKAMNNNPSITKMYMGSPQGIHRSYPALRWQQKTQYVDVDHQQCRVESETCPTYDPRVRPWYVIAASGPKDVVLVLDTSGSTSKQGRIDLIQAAAKKIIGGLGSSDYLGIVTFGTIATTYSDTLVKVDNIKEDVDAWIDSIIPAGETNFAEGFNTAFKMMKDSITAQKTSACKTAVIFLTDGVNTGISPLTTIQEYSKQEPNMVIFTYTLGSGAEEEEPKEIACATNGLYAHIPDGGDLSSYMSNYYLYFAAVNRDESVIWTSPYEDFNGLGRSISPTKACYAVNGELIGIVSGNVKLSSNDEQEITAAIANYEVKCSYRPLSEELLETLQDGQCSTSPTWLYVTGPIVGVGVIVLAVICCMKRKKKVNNQDDVKMVRKVSEKPKPIENSYNNNSRRSISSRGNRNIEGEDPDLPDFDA